MYMLLLQILFHNYLWLNFSMTSACRECSGLQDNTLYPFFNFTFLWCSLMDVDIYRFPTLYILSRLETVGFEVSVDHIQRTLSVVLYPMVFIIKTFHYLTDGAIITSK